MRDFRKLMLSTIAESSAMAKRFYNEAQAALERVDWDDVERRFNERKTALIEQGKKLMDDVDELFRDIHQSMEDFQVSVPCNRANGENVEWGIEGNTLTIKVSSQTETESSSMTRKVTIPENCDVGAAHLVSDDKTVTVVIPKVIGTSDTEEHIAHDEDSETVEEARMGGEVDPDAVETEEDEQEADAPQDVEEDDHDGVGDDDILEVLAHSGNR